MSQKFYTPQSKPVHSSGRQLEEDIFVTLIQEGFFVSKEEVASEEKSFEESVKRIKEKINLKQFSGTLEEIAKEKAKLETEQFQEITRLRYLPRVKVALLNETFVARLKKVCNIYDDEIHNFIYSVILYEDKTLTIDVKVMQEIIYYKYKEFLENLKKHNLQLKPKEEVFL